MDEHREPEGRPANLSLRDILAIEAARVCLGYGPALPGMSDNELTAVSRGAYAFADAMLAAREKGAGDE